MTFLTQKHLSRRAALKGLGATIALPFLDAMIPASTAWAKVADRKLRLIAMEMVHGAAGSTTFGAKMNLWAPPPRPASLRALTSRPPCASRPPMRPTRLAKSSA